VAVKIFEKPNDDLEKLQQAAKNYFTELEFYQGINPHPSMA